MKKKMNKTEYEIEKIINNLNPKLSNKNKMYAIKTIKQCKSKSDLNLVCWLMGRPDIINRRL